MPRSTRTDTLVPYTTLFRSRAAKSARPTRYGVAFWTVRKDVAVLLRRRPEKGLLGGMMEVPSTAWRGERWSLAEAKAGAPLRGRWRLVDGAVRSEEHTSELQSLLRISYAVFCLKKKTT